MFCICHWGTKFICVLRLCLSLSSHYAPVLERCSFKKNFFLCVLSYVMSHYKCTLDHIFKGQQNIHCFYINTAILYSESHKVIKSRTS